MKTLTAKTLTAFSTLLVLGTIANSQVKQTGGAYSFQLKYTKGAIIRQDIKIDITSPSKMSTTMAMTLQVLSVDANGTAKVKAKVAAAKLGPATIPASETAMTMDKFGTAKGATPGVASDTLYPRRAMKVGDVYKAKTMSNNVPVDGTLKFLGIQNFKGVQCAAFDSTLSGTGSTKLKGTGKLYIRVSDGAVFNNTVKVTMAAPGAGGKPQNISMVVSSSTR